MHLFSRIPSAVRYDLRGSEFLLEPGENAVLPAQLERLRANDAFKKHLAGGHVTVPGAVEPVNRLEVVIDPAEIRAAAEQIASEPPAPVEEPPSDPRARIPGESKANHAKRLAALDAPPRDYADIFAQWDKMDAATRTAVWPTLQPDEQAAIIARSAE